MRGIAFTTAAALVIVTGCGRPPAFSLPADRIERAATCGAVAWADLSAAEAGGRPRPASVLRVVHYALLAFDDEEPYNSKIAQAVGQRIVTLHRAHVTYPAEARPACARAFPATVITLPRLPSTPLDGTLECAMIIDYARRRLNGVGMHAAAADYDDLRGRFLPYVKRWMASDMLRGGVGEAWRKASLIGAAHLGRPADVIEACRVGFQRIVSAPPPFPSRS